MTDPCSYVYLDADRPIGKRIAYYYDHLENARAAGHGCLADWVRALHAEHDGKATKVGEALGLTYYAVTGWFRNLGLPVRTRGGKDPMVHPRRGEVGDIYQQTGSGIKTAEILGVSPPLVYKWLRADRKKGGRE
jgi:hypothetical protein